LGWCRPFRNLSEPGGQLSRTYPAADGNANL
jgi:hypothetical protein